MAADRGPRPVTLSSSDGTSVFGLHYSTGDKSLPAILLFHQAGSNYVEYATIAPPLAAPGYHLLAIDQRSRGSMWGRSNRTADEFGRDIEYRAVLPDLEAVLEWPPRNGFPLRSIVWGSSYSAALVFLLAAKHPSEVESVIAFSPGEYLGDNHTVRDVAVHVQAPVFVTSASDSEEVAAARTLVRAVPHSSAVQFIPDRGIHGSSTRLQDRNPAGAAENWRAVEAFLARMWRSRQRHRNSGFPRDEINGRRRSSPLKFGAR